MSRIVSGRRSTFLGNLSYFTEGFRSSDISNNSRRYSIAANGRAGGEGKRTEGERSTGVRTPHVAILKHTLCSNVWTFAARAMHWEQDSTSYILDSSLIVQSSWKSLCYERDSSPSLHSWRVRNDAITSECISHPNYCGECRGGGFVLGAHLPKGDCSWGQCPRGCPRANVWTQSIAHALSGINVAPHGESKWKGLFAAQNSKPQTYVNLAMASRRAALSDNDNNNNNIIIIIIIIISRQSDLQQGRPVTYKHAINNTKWYKNLC